MSLHQGSLSMCRYRLIGTNKKFRLAKLNELLEPYKAAEVKLSGVHREELCGWVKPIGLDDNDPGLPNVHWDMAAGQLEDGFVLRMRCEKRTVPSQLLQLIYKQRLANLEESKSGRKEKRKLRDQIKRELLTKALPAISYIDAYWQDEYGLLYLMTTGKSARLSFEKLFTATFADHLDLTLLQVQPPLLGLSEDQWSDGAAADEVINRLSLTFPLSISEHMDVR